MTIALLIFLIAFYFLLNVNKILSKKDYVAKDVIENLHSRNYKTTVTQNKSLSPESSHATMRDYSHLYKDADFVNKDCKNLDDFIIHAEMNSFDLMKLADLNQIRLQIPDAWHPITLELIKELNENGWNKRVSCIKEKYASIRFYIDERFDEIIDKYERLSMCVCQTCGEKGEVRHQSFWEYVACRKHYLEDRGKITIEDSGFSFKGNSFKWSEIKDAAFDDLDYYEKYKFLKIKFDKAIATHPGWVDDTLYVPKYAIGFGDFLGQFSKSFNDFGHRYINRYYKEATFCAICGYLAVYEDECECCENHTWKAYQAHWKNTDDNENDYNKYRQVWWNADQGEFYENQLKNYQKNPEYKILFTNKDLSDYFDSEADS